MDPYQHNPNRRVTEEELRGYAAQKHEITLVNGLENVLERGGAIHNGDRVAGFMETHDVQEWVLPLSASDPLVWETGRIPDTPEKSVGFVVSMGFGNGNQLPQPSGQWDVWVNEREVCSIRVVKHSQAWDEGNRGIFFTANRIEAAEPGGGLTLSSVIRDESFAAFGPAIIDVPTAWLQTGESAEIRVEPCCHVASDRWFQLASAPSIIHQADIYRVLDLRKNGRLRKSSGKDVYFGDIHTHSGDVPGKSQNEGCGRGSREENYEYARGPGGLDFYALTDHEWQIDQDRIQQYLDLASDYSGDDFACLPAFEHTNLVYGHRNIYFRGPGGTVVNARRGWGRPSANPDEALTPEELWSELDETGVPYLSVPHHPSAASHPFNWDHYHPAHDRLVEVYSCWGSSEYYGDTPRGVSDRYRSLGVRDALNRGFHVGIVASADGHDGHPGNAQSPGVKHHHLFHHCGSGLVGVLSDELCGDSIFDALYARRCYGTSGVPIGLEFEIAGQPMGSVLPPERVGIPVIKMACRGTNGLREVRIVRDGQVVNRRLFAGERNCEMEWADEDYDTSTSSYYYVRVVQQDYESAWSSPIWIG